MAFSGALVPGPLLTYTISESAKKGFWVGPFVIAGHAMIEFIILIILLTGIKAFFEHKLVLGIITTAGSLLIFWIAKDLFFSIKNLKFETADGEKTKSGNSIINGFLISLFNPYLTIWWLTIGIGYLTYSFKFGIAGIAAFFVGHELADLLWYSIVSFGMAKSRKFINLNIYRIIIIVCAVALTFFACWFFYTGVQGIIKFL